MILSLRVGNMVEGPGAKTLNVALGKGVYAPPTVTWSDTKISA
jgi:hypothetical protein